MQLYLIVALLCLRQCVAAQKYSHTEGLVNLSVVTTGERQLWSALDDLALQKAFNNVLHQQTMTSQRVDPVTATWRALGNTSDSFVKIDSYGHSNMKGNVSSLESLPARRRQVGDRDSASLEVISEHVDGRALENKESEANTPSWPSTDHETQSAYVYSAGGQEVAEEQKKASASQDGEKENKNQGGDENFGMSVRTGRTVSSNGASSSDQSNFLNIEGRQPSHNHNEANTRGQITGSAAHTSETTQDVNPGRAETNERASMNSGTAGTGDRFQNSFTVVEVQPGFEAEGNPEEGEEQDDGYGDTGELRILGRKRNYRQALPMKFPSVGPPPALQQAPKPNKVSPPPPPTKIVQPKRPWPPPKKVSTFKEVLVPPTKVHKVHKMPPPLKVVHPKKVVPPPKKYVLPKKVVYPKKKLHPKKVHTKYIPARKKYVPLTKYVPAPTKFARAPVYVPVPKKL